MMVSSSLCLRRDYETTTLRPGGEVLHNFDAGTGAELDTTTRRCFRYA